MSKHVDTVEGLIKQAAALSYFELLPSLIKLREELAVSTSPAPVKAKPGRKGYKEIKKIFDEAQAATVAPGKKRGRPTKTAAKTA